MRALPFVLLIACPPVTPEPDDTDETDTIACDGDPSAPELCNGEDDNCDGELLVEEQDADGDGAPDCASCVEAGYFDALAEVGDDELRATLHELTDEADCSYNRARSEIFQVLDDDAGGVRCVYTDRWFPVDEYPPNDWQDVNTEHSWPQSMGADVDPMQCDVHHLFPSDADVNAIRGNYPFDDVSTIDDDGDSRGSWNGSLAGRTSSGERVFEPRDAHKGDVARAMLYFYARYDDRLTSSQIADFATDRLTTYQSWNTLDPVDEREFERTFGIAEYQGHANPFVVCPGLLDRFVESER